MQATARFRIGAHVGEQNPRSGCRAGAARPRHAVRVAGSAGAVLMTCGWAILAAPAQASPRGTTLAPFHQGARLGEAPAAAVGRVGVTPARPVAVRRTVIAAGLYHSLALSSTGAVFSRGWNIVGQLGNRTTNGSAVPVRVRLPGDTTVFGIAAGFAHSVAVTSTGAVYAWGKNYNGSLGDGSTTDSPVPVKVQLPPGTRVTAVAAGAEHSLAVTSTGAVLAWGYNNDGQLGNGSAGSSDVPVSVSLPAGTKVTTVAAGALHSLALTATGAVLAWGYNTDGELGDGSTRSSAVPVRVRIPEGRRVTSVAAGELHSLTVTATGGVLAWGGDDFGQLGDGSYSESDVPMNVRMPAGTKVSTVATGRIGTLRAGRMRSASALEAGLTARFGLAEPGLAATAHVASTRSTVFAGYDLANYIGVPGAVSATVVVPKLHCRIGAPAGSAIEVGVGLQSVTSYARLQLACTPPGVAHSYPSLVVNGSTRNFPRDLARAGDRVEFALSQSDSQVTVSVVDVTHRFIVTGNGTGTGEGILIGDFPAVSGATMSGVPNFGTLAFSSALINGYPIGSTGTGLQVDNLYASSSGPLQIRTTYPVSNKEAFTTVFIHV